MYFLYITVQNLSGCVSEIFERTVLYMHIFGSGSVNFLFDFPVFTGDSLVEYKRVILKPYLRNLWRKSHDQVGKKFWCRRSKPFVARTSRFCLPESRNQILKWLCEFKSPQFRKQVHVTNIICTQQTSFQSYMRNK